MEIVTDLFFFIVTFKTFYQSGDWMEADLNLSLQRARFKQTTWLAIAYVCIPPLKKVAPDALAVMAAMPVSSSRRGRFARVSSRHGCQTRAK